MKTKKYEKVIEWEKKPNRKLIIKGVLLFVFVFLNFVIANSLIYSSMEDLIFILVANMVIFLLSGLNRLENGLGEGKKVYYKEMK